MKKIFWVAIFLAAAISVKLSAASEECGFHEPAGSWYHAFGVPYLSFPGPDITSLPEIYQTMIARMAMVPTTERPPLACCFAEGTDPEIVNRVSQILYGEFSPLDFQLNTRWSSTANGGTGSAGDPITLTFSFAPDGISIPNGVGEGAGPNTLFATMNALFGGNTEAWKDKFRQVFQQWSDLIGINYIEVTDDGAAWGSAGSLGNRGDVRIFAKAIDGGSGILAYNYFPNSGDMVLDNGENWASSSNNYRFMRNTVSHEHGHGMGLSHVCPIAQTKLMEPYLSTSFDGPQHDDIRGGQRHYGDWIEQNDNSGQAYDMGTLPIGNTTVNNICSDKATDEDWYRFTVNVPTTVSITVHPVGATYTEGPQTSQCNTGTSINTVDDQNLSVTLVASNGSTVLATANSQPAGVDEVISNYIISTPGNYYAHVIPQSGATTVQIYSLTIGSLAAGPSITVSAPNGGETWITGGTQAINWSSTGVSGNVRIELNRSFPSLTWETLFSSTANDGTQNWTVSGTGSSACRVRVTSVNVPTIGDTSNASFTIVVPSITVSSPNGGETWFMGNVQTVLWTSQAISGNVNIELNRNYPAGGWESLFANSANDGTQSWTVAGAASTNARIRVSSVGDPTINDVSNAAFVISNPTITVTRPNGGETLNGAALESLTWTTNGVISGNVTIELNRSYPSGSWLNLTTVPNTGNYSLVLGGPSTSAARVRITSVNIPSATDMSNGNFTISAPNTPPIVLHDSHQDAEPGLITFTALVTDDYDIPTTRIFKKLAAGGQFDSTLMSATGNPDEYSAVLNLADGAYLYFLKAADGSGLVTISDTFALDIGSCDLALVAQDDGTPEGFNYAENCITEWAIKVEPQAFPFALCMAELCIAATVPDSQHSPIRVRVLDSDGVSGTPGTEIWSENSGSIGNQIGGLEPGVVHWANVLIEDALSQPLLLDSPFYLAVSNPEPGKFEAFGRDANSPAIHSYFYDPCDSVWYREDDQVPGAQNSARMIRIHGVSLAPPQNLTILRVAGGIQLNWQAPGGAASPYYRVYAADSVQGPFTNLIGATSSNSFVDTTAPAGYFNRFYLVTGSTQP